MTTRNLCLNCGKLVPRGHGYKSSQLYCDRACWKAKPPKVVAVEVEFGEPFADIVKGFAEMGYSRTVTAGALGFNLSYFRNLLKRSDLDAYFLPQAQQRPECRGKGVSRGCGAKRPGNGPAQKYSDAFLLECVASSGSSRRFKDQFSIDPGTVRYRFGSWQIAKKLAAA